MENTKKTSRVAGILYVIVAITGFFTTDAWNKVIVSGNVKTTISNMTSNESLFRISLFSNVIMSLAWIILSLYLYKIFKAKNKMNSLIMVIFVVLGSTMTLFCSLTKTTVIEVITSDNYLSTSGTGQLDTLVSTLLLLSNSGTMYAFIFFGLWLLPLGILVFQSDISPGYIRIPLSVLLFIAGIGYLLDYIIFQFHLPVETKITSFTFYGEVFLLLWLLTKGISIQKA